MLQPSSQSDKHKEHRRGVEKGNRALDGTLGHGNDKYHTGVDVGYGGGQHNKHVHVSCAVFQRAVCLDVEVSASKNLKGGGEY